MFWTSFKNSIAMIVAMVVIPTVIGLLLASVLFDYLGKRFGSSGISVLRAVLYLPQVLPVVVAGIVWGWILRPDGAFNAFLDAIGLQGVTRDWLGDPNTALPMVMLVMVWVQIGYPVVIFMSALGRVDPEISEAAEISGTGLPTALTEPSLRVGDLDFTVRRPGRSDGHRPRPDPAEKAGSIVRRADEKNGGSASTMLAVSATVTFTLPDAAQ